MRSDFEHGLRLVGDAHLFILVFLLLGVADPFGLSAFGAPGSLYYNLGLGVVLDTLIICRSSSLKSEPLRRNVLRLVKAITTFQLFYSMLVYLPALIFTFFLSTYVCFLFCIATALLISPLDWWTAYVLLTGKGRNSHLCSRPSYSTGVLFLYMMVRLLTPFRYDLILLSFLHAVTAPVDIAVRLATTKMFSL